MCVCVSVRACVHVCVCVCVCVCEHPLSAGVGREETLFMVIICCSTFTAEVWLLNVR